LSWPTNNVERGVMVEASSSSSLGTVRLTLPKVICGSNFLLLGLCVPFKASTISSCNVFVSLESRDPTCITLIFFIFGKTLIPQSLKQNG